MIVVHAKSKIKPECIEAFLEQAEIVIRATRAEAGCISYQLMADTVSNDSFMFVEEWTDREALDRHFKTPHFAAFGSTVKDMRLDRSVKVFQAEEIKI
ncbi:YcnE [Acetonema longum DSM 6540]|uniref:YcnE n=2 Tax=Acetonema TaxID=2373 RepID=F7NDK1_9FIRM|nr:YcnE [Acetonema longum DSM 6540]